MEIKYFCPSAFVHSASKQAGPASQKWRQQGLVMCFQSRSGPCPPQPSLVVPCLPSPDPLYFRASLHSLQRRGANVINGPLLLRTASSKWQIAATIAQFSAFCWDGPYAIPPLGRTMEKRFCQEKYLQTASSQSQSIITERELHSRLSSQKIPTKEPPEDHQSCSGGLRYGRRRPIRPRPSDPEFAAQLKRGCCAVDMGWIGF